MIFVPRICEERAGTPLQLLSKLTGTRLLILAGLLVLIAALVEASQRLRAQAPTVPAPFPAEEAYVPVLPPNLARDPFLSATPKPPAIVGPRPNVRGEAVMALLAVGAYLAVFAMSAFGGEKAPDLLSIRANGGSNPAPSFAADVLSTQSTVAPAVTETMTPPAAPVVDPAPPSQPEPAHEATQAPPNQHVLRSGETLISVAALYGTTAYDLATANGLTGDLIYAGQVLKIPAR
jgi:LysM repeat protein